MRQLDWSFTALLLASGFGGLAGCGGSSGGGASDSGVAADGSLADGSVSGGADSSDTDTGAHPSTDDAGDDASPGCLTPDASTASCRACCAKNYAAGSQVFDRFTVECACQPAYCGVAEAGIGDDGGGVPEAGTDGAAADAGLYGSGICAATCTQKVAPDPACNTCILSTLGGFNDFGPCGDMVLSECLTDTSCSAYLIGCVESCPP